MTDPIVDYVPRMQARRLRDAAMSLSILGRMGEARLEVVVRDELVADMVEAADTIARLDADLAARDAEIARIIGDREHRVAELLAANNRYQDEARAARGLMRKRAICDALGFDPENHHNAARCPYCTIAPTAVPES